MRLNPIKIGENFRIESRFEEVPKSPFLYFGSGKIKNLHFMDKLSCNIFFINSHPNNRKQIMGGIEMLKDFTWDFFEKTGSIETFLEYSMIQGITGGEDKDDSDVKRSDN